MDLTSSNMAAKAREDTVVSFKIRIAHSSNKMCDVKSDYQI